MSRERRSYPRYPVDFVVSVVVPADPTVTVHVAGAANISCTSIQFNCQAELVAALLRQQTLPYTCELQFHLPWHVHEFRLKALVVTHRRLSQQQYVLVLLFRHEDEAQELLLDRLLASQQTVGLS
jgi:hypothetical protein